MAFINRFSTTQNGAIVITGNTLGLSKATNQNTPGTNDSIGGFITTNTALPVPSGWAGIVNLANGENVTLNWQDNSSSAFLNIPSGSTVVYAELIWGGLARSGTVDVTSFTNNSIKFTTPIGTTSVLPDPATSFNEAWYLRSQNVTSLVAAGGVGKYIIGAVPSALDPSNNSTNFAGWSLIVVYNNASLPARNMSVFSGGEIVESNGVVDTTVSGFITPASGTITARILVSAGEGDATRAGDSMKFGPSVNSLTELSGPNNLANPPNSIDNFFASQINIGDPNNPNVGKIDTTGSFGNRNSNASTQTNISAGRQGWDITNVNGSAALVNGQTTATVRFQTAGDVYITNGLAIQIDTIAADVSVVKTGSPSTVIPGNSINYTLVISNAGPNTAQNVVLTDLIPGSISNSQFSIDGGVTYNPWVSPYTIGTLAVGSSVNILIKGTVILSATGTITNIATVSSTTPDSNINNNTSTVVTQVTPTADILVSKAVTPISVNAGDDVLYTIKVSNQGPDSGQNVSLADIVPPQILNQEFSVDGGLTYNIWTSPYNIGTLVNGDLVTILIRGKVNPSAIGTITNTATATSTTLDPNPSNNSSTVVTTLNTSAALSIVKLGSAQQAVAGQSFTYSMIIANGGPSDALNVVLADNVPVEVLNPEFSSNGGVSWSTWITPYTIGTLKSGDEITIQIRGIVNSVATGSITNTGEVSSTTFDPNLSNNTSTLITPVITSADLSVIKTASANPVLAGDVLTYTVKVTNGGPSLALNVSLTDAIPGEVISPQFSIDGGINFNPWVSPYNIGSLESGSSVTILIKGIVSASAIGSITNTAIVTSSTPDPNESNNTAAVVTDVTPSADILVSKSVSPLSINAGENILYTIKVSNQGPADSQNVSLVDIVPAQVLNQEFSIDGGLTYSPWSSPYNIGTLVNGALVTILIRGQVDSSATGSITNTANATSVTHDPNQSNNSSTVVSTLNTSAELSVVKLGGAQQAIAGQSFTYSMVISNGGPSDALNVSLADEIPNEVLNPEFSSNGGGTWSAWISPYTIGTLKSGEQITILIRGTVNSLATGSITNTGVVSSTTFDPNLANNTSTLVTPVVASADISVIKTASANLVLAGDVLTYSIKVSNAGPSQALNVSLTDAIPGTVISPEFSIDGGITFNPWVSPYNIGSLASGDFVTVLIKGTVSSSAIGSISNTAIVSASTPDPNQSNNTASVVTDVTPSADILVSKSVLPISINAGDNILYTIKVSNQGPANAQNVSLEDIVPPEVLNQQFSLDGGVTYNPWSSPYNIGTLVNGDLVTILIRGQVNPSATGTIINTATATSITSDPNLNNNTSTVISTLNTLADISILKLGNPFQVTAGEVLTYSLVISNSGPSDALNVTLTDNVPASITGVEFSLDGGVTYNQWVSPYSIGTVTSNTSLTILIKGTVNPSATGTITNTATITSTTQDPNPGDNTSTAVTTILTSADILVTKAANPSPVIAGDLLTYFMTISNRGPSSALNVSLADSLPDSLTGAEFSTDGGGSWNSWVSPYNIGTLANGATENIQIRGTVKSSVVGNITNTATVNSTTPDPDNDDNTSTVITEVSTSADVSVVKTASPNPVQAGQLLTYSIVVANAGLSDAQNVILDDNVPGTLTGVQFSSDDGATWNTWVSPYSIGTLTSGNSINIQIRGTVNPLATGTITNTATVSSTTIDPNLQNNTSTIITGINTSADISVIKTSNPNPVIAGQLLTYTMEVSNAGPNTAQNVTLTDNVSATLTGVQFSIDGGVNWNPWVSPYTIGTLGNGNTLTILIRGTVNPLATGTITNTVEVDSTTPDSNPDNNSSTVNTAINLLADISVVKTDSPNPVVGGELLTYTMVVSNAGPNDAQNVTLTDNVPGTLTGVEFSTDGGLNWSNWVSPYFIGTLTNGNSQTIKIRGTVDPSAVGTITNTATVSSTTPDSNEDNNTSTINTTVNTLANISVVKTANPNPGSPGQVVIFSMLVSNAGPSDAQNVTLTDAVPATILNQEFSSNGGGTWSPWVSPYNMGAISNSGSKTIEIRGTVSPLATGVIKNTAIVASTTFDPDTSDNISTVDLKVTDIADLLVVKTFNPEVVNAGDSVNYTINILNGGPADAQNVMLTDVVPPEILNPQFSVDGGATYSTWNSPYTIGTITNGESVVIIIKGSVNPSATGSIINTATVSSTTFDPNLNNNSSTVVINLTTSASLSILKLGSAQQAVAGQSFTYSMVISNGGPSDALNVSLVDEIPIEVLNPEFSSNGGGTWVSWITPYTIGTLKSGEQITTLIRGIVDSEATGSITNTATISSTTFDPNLSNNTSTLITPVNTLADISVLKTASANVVLAGDVLTYSVKVSNDGPSVALNVSLADEVPSTVISPQFSIDGGINFNPWISPYNIGDLASGSSVTILIKGIVSPLATGSITNIAIATSSTPDPDQSNNIASVVTDVTPSADILVSKSVTPFSINAGDNILYTIEVSNQGAYDAQNVSLEDIVPPQILNQEFSIDGGLTYNPWNSPYNIGTLLNGELVTILIRGKVNSSATGAITNTATVSSTTHDPNPSNNTSTVVSNLTTSAAVSIVKLGSSAEAVAGQSFTYSMIISNGGPSDALNIVLKDEVPIEVLNPEFSSNGGSTWSNWITPYTVGTLRSGDEITMQIRGIVNSIATGSITNTGEVSSTTFDPDLSNNTSTLITPVITSADLSIIKIASASLVLAGDILTYSVAVSNNGPSQALNVSLIDSMPGEILSPQFSIDGGINFNPWVNPYNIGSLESGDLVTILLKGTVSKLAIGSITNTAIVTSSTADPNQSNNTASVVTDVTPSADILVSKSVTPISVNAGDHILYTIKVINEGPASAENVSLLDVVQGEILNQEFSTDGGLTYNPWSSPYNIGTLLNGDLVTILIRGQVDPSATGTITNTATVSSTTSDPNPSNNSSTVEQNLTTSAATSIVKLGSSQQAVAGQSFTYSMVISNGGPSNALVTILEDEVPIQVLNQEYSVDGGVTWSAWVTPYTIGTVVSGNSNTIQIRGIINSGATGSIINTGKITSITSNPNLSNNTSTLVTEVNTSADISVVKTANPVNLTIGDIVTYNINLSNEGPSDAQNVLLSDIVPSQILSPEISIDNGLTWSEWISPFNASNIVAKSQRVILIRGKVSNTALGLINNISNVSSITPDPNTSNNSSNAVINVQYANLVSTGNFTKSVDKNIAIVGEEITYTINVTNTGNAVANNVVISDSIPVGTSYVLGSLIGSVELTGSPEGNINITNGISQGQSITLSFKVIINELPNVNPIPNTALVSYTYTVDPVKPNGANASGTSNTVTTKVVMPQLTLSKTSSKSVVNVGDTFSYSIIASNTGNTSLENVIIQDSLPPEFQVTEITVGGSLITGDLNLGVDIGTIDISTSKNIKITINVIGSLGGIFKNIVNAVAKSNIDPANPPITVNATATDNIGVQVFNPQLTLTKSVDKPYAVVGQTVTYTIVAKNTGDITLGNVALSPITIFDILSPSLSFVSGSVKVNGIQAPLLDIGSGVDIGQLLPGESTTVTFEAVVISAEINKVTNTASGTYGYEIPGYPPKIGNAISNTVILVAEVVNVDVIKTSDKDFLVLGDTVTYTVIIKNTGTLDAINVMFKDSLPKEVELIAGSFSINGVVVNSVNIRNSINIGTIKSGQQDIIKYTVKLVKSNCKLQIVNAASVTFQYKFPDGSGGAGKSEDTSDSKVVVILGISNFKQISIDEELEIPRNKPEIAQISEVTCEIVIIKSHIIKTPILLSNEGQRLTGFKLIVHGVINEVVEYIALNREQSVNLAHYTIPFSTFIILPADYCSVGDIEIKGVIEDIYFREINCRTLFTNATVLVKAIVCEC